MPRATHFDAAALLRKAEAAGDADLDLAPTALAFSMIDLPQSGDADSYMAHLTALGAATRASCAKGFSLPEALARVLVGEYGYHGDIDTYDDIANADLASVIDRRKGIPVSLGILFIWAARQAGGTAKGLNVPGHFLLAAGIKGEEYIIDPFNGGRQLDDEDLHALLQRMYGRGQSVPEPRDLPRMSDRAVLIRLLNNIRTRVRERSDHVHLFEIVGKMMRLSPRDAELWYERGISAAAIERPAAAIEAIERALALAPDAHWRGDAARTLAGLRRSLN
ncbi:MAG: hypothetical protein HXY22_11085 [Alphaproteobacteria bacterium]|nr:hypothetical protein [Alphaproteobacteria bacterium]